MYSNSPLVDLTCISPNTYGLRDHAIDTITIHVFVGQASAQTIGNVFLPKSRRASCNYGIAKDGQIVLVVEEKNASQCTSSKSNDERAITIECASDAFHPYKINDKVYESLIKLLVDICKRNPTIGTLKWEGDKNLLNQVDKQNITLHRWFANKACPGQYVLNKLPQIVKDVNLQLEGFVPDKPKESNVGEVYRVRISWDQPKTQLGAFKILRNAIGICKEGYHVYDSNGVQVYPEPATDMKDIRQMALDVIAGKYGNGLVRRTKLGNLYTEVQSEVNRILKGGK